MTTRGNPSISPPVQISLQSQPRNVPNIPSGTPPPSQPFYPGQSTYQYEIIQQAPPQGLQTYQAYGSAHNDLTRGSSAPSGRGAMFQGNLSQSGSFNQPSGQTMRPPQGTGQYFLGGHSQGTIRPRHPHPPGNQQHAMVLVPQFTQSANNMVISPTMYQPQVFPTNTFNPPYTGPGGPSTNRFVYFPNGIPRGGQQPVIPNQVSLQAPRRGKRVIAITDPTTGRNVLDDFLSTQPPKAEGGERTAEASANEKGIEIRKSFTRQVAEILKTNDEPQGAQETPVPVLQSSQEHPQQQQFQQQHVPPPPQPAQAQQPMPLTATPLMRPPNMPTHQQQTPPTMMGGQTSMLPPHMMGQHSDVMQQQQQQQPPLPSVTPPNMQHHAQTGMPMPYMNIPPPHLHHYNPRHPQNPPVRAAMPPPAPVMTPPAHQMTPPQAPSASITPTSLTETSTPRTKELVAPVAPVQAVEQPIVAEPIPPVDIPAQTQATLVQAPAQATQPQTENPAPQVKEVEPVQKPVVPVTDPAPMPVPVPKEEPVLETPVPEPQTVAPVKADAPAEVSEVPKETSTPTPSASSQGTKDGVRKVRKNKKEFNRKDVEGSDMDAFIDGKENDGAMIEQSTTKSAVEALPTESQKAPEKVQSQNNEPKVEDVERPATASPVSGPSEDKPVAPRESDKVETQNEEEPLKQDQPEEPEKVFIPNGKESKSDDLPESIPAKEEPTEVVETTRPTQQTQNEENEPPKEKDSFKNMADMEPAFRASERIAVKQLKKDVKEKLQYDRTYLMELRECPTSQTKPVGLPNLEVILDQPVNSARGTSGAPKDFTPSYFESSVRPHAPAMGKSSSRGRSRPGDVQMNQRVITRVSITNNAKPLHQSEKPWKPARKDESSVEKKSLESEVLFIMNRLTPTNFERLAIEMKKLNIKTYEDLQDLVKIFFDKVTMETKFVQAYATLCKVMSGLRVPPPPNSNIKETQATFRVVMLTKCQQEFEADKSIIFESPEEKKKKIETDMPEDTPERAELIENTLYQMKLKRMKFYGNIRFIGELFKLGMLTENIMHDCIYRLLKARDDDSLLSLCQLITTVGQGLDTDKAKTRMDQYFNQMSKIADERKSRIKFTLKDAVDLRSNNWVPRKETTGPKKIDDVHKDFVQEQARSQFLSSQPLPPRNDTPQPGSRRGSRQRQDDSNKPNDDGWNTVGSRSMKIDASKMRLSKSVVDEKSIQLGPGGGMNRPMWGRGSHGGAASQDERQSAPANRFSALQKDEDRRTFQKSPSREGPAGRSLRQGATVGHGRGKIISRSSTEGERRDAIASARSILGGRSQNSSRDNSWNRDDRRHIGPRSSKEGDIMTRSDISLRPNEEFRAPAPLGGKKALTEDEMEFKSKNIMEEYLNIRILDEAKLCVKELEGQPLIHLFVTSSMNNVLEKSDQERFVTGEFFHELVQSKLMPLDTYFKGLAEVLKYAEDMVIDIPKLWAYIAQMISPLLIGESVVLSQLKTVLKLHLEDRYCALLLAQILVQAAAKMGEQVVAVLWQNSGLEWSMFVQSDTDKFVQNEGVAFSMAPVSGSSAFAGSQRFIDGIKNLIKEKRKAPVITTYIEKNFPGDKSDNAFIRALTTAVVSSSLTEHTQVQVDDNVLKEYSEVLQKYIGTNRDSALQALYAIQALMFKLEHPNGVIYKLFNGLYDNDVIEEETFHMWNNSTDPHEQEGKGVCKLQVTQFFTWLQENEEIGTS